MAFDNTNTGLPQFMPCRKCAGGNSPGYMTKVIEDNGTKYRILVPCECYVAYSKKVETYLAVKKGNLPPAILTYDPKEDYVGKNSWDSVTKLMIYVGAFPEKYWQQSLYLRGPYGTQKTTLARWAGMALIRDYGIDVYYILMRTLTNALVEDMYDRADEDPEIKNERKNILQRARECKVLIIDESFDLTKMTLYKSNYQIPFLDEFIRTRIDKQGKPIIFVSNIPISGIDNNFSALRDLLDRTIKQVNGELDFKDNYMKLKNDFDVKDIFA